MPHIGMALQNEADMCCCNHSKESWKTNRHEVMRIYDNPIKSAFNNHTRKIIAATLDNGIRHTGCQECWNAEDSGNQSPRQTWNKLIGEVPTLPDQPQVLIIKPGNTCNFACRMCNPETSSSWYKDGYKLDNPGVPFNQYTHKFEIIRNSFNPSNLELWTTLKQWIAEFKVIAIFGGEPFLIPALFDLLDHAVKIGAAQDITLSLHTNASIYNVRYLEILSKFKLVKLNVSLDAVDPNQLTYIRHKLDYDQVVDNVKNIKNFFDNYPNIELGITATITPLNVYYIDQICQDLVKDFGLEVGTNIVITPEYDIRHLPIPVKNLLIDRLTNQTVINFLKHTIPGCDIEWPKFCRVTDQLDQLRNQSFADTFPEWWAILEPYWIRP
jgi:MoaA/NifB/PqqE/SkfB family radical SAM enzyme